MSSHYWCNRRRWTPFLAYYKIKYYLLFQLIDFKPAHSRFVSRGSKKCLRYASQSVFIESLSFARSCASQRSNIR